MPENKEKLLSQLYDLMQKSPSILSIPLERRETIRQKYQNADEDQILRGIQMLHEEQQRIQEENQKSLRKFEENSQKRKRLLEEEKNESSKEQQQALQLLNQMNQKTSTNHLKINVVLIGVVVFLLIFILIIMIVSSK